MNGADARYLLVVGHAVGLHGRPRATKDFDLWIEASEDNARRVMEALQEFGAPLGDVGDVGDVGEADFARPGTA